MLNLVKKYFCGVLLFFVAAYMITPSSNASAAMAKGDKFVGNIIGTSIPENFAEYWNQVTTVDSAIWSTVEPMRNRMNWTNLDVAYKYCKENHMPFKFNTLIWQIGVPQWVGNISNEEQKKEISEWIASAGKRYPDADFVDVVNEPVNSKPFYIDAIGGKGDTGWDWVIWSFEQARMHFPESRLLINETEIIDDPVKTTKFIEIINILKEKKLIDGIGMECHYYDIDKVSTATMITVLDMLAETGLPIYISELDITGDDVTQLARYKEKFPILYEHPQVEGITLWGWIKDQTWQIGTELITIDGEERPALTWLKKYLSQVETPFKVTPVNTKTPTTLKLSGDLNYDNVINMADVILLAKAFNSVKGEIYYILVFDLNRDGAINMLDVIVMAGNFNSEL